ncbi:hypothetical protein ACKWTF_016724 [Chironomus riparius]
MKLNDFKIYICQFCVVYRQEKSCLLSIKLFNKMSLKFILLILSFPFIVSSQDAVGSGTCNYIESKTRRFTGYLCKLSANESEVLTEIDGGHLEGKTDDDLTYVTGSNLTFMTLTSIFCEKFKNTERMSIFKSKVNKIDENALEKRKNLELFDFCDTKVSVVPEKLFLHNSKLKVIKLNRNRITTLPENVFSNLKDLLNIFIYSNEISYLPPNIFKSNTKLRLLFLDNNKLTAINSNWFVNMPDLDRLNLADNQILDLPQNAFINLKILPFIWLANNNLTVIHSDSFGVNDKLEHLYLRNNKIIAIDEKFVINTAIQKIDMSGNVCSQEDINNRFQIKEAFQKCFDNYRPRKEQT